MIEVPGYLDVAPSIYCSQEQHDLEIEGTFNHSWLLLAAVSELPNDGDYLSRDILGTPTLAWNTGRIYKAYINVCPHRNSMLMDPNITGNADILKCPYHGWEFNTQGKVCKIPDAQCFKGLKKEGDHKLQPIQIEQLGDFLFVCLDPDNSCNLKDYMGNRIYNSIQEMSESFTSYVMYREKDMECNWKTILETSIEDYHVPCVHNKTLGQGVALSDIPYSYEKSENGSGCMSSAGGTGKPGACDLHAPFVTLSLFCGLHITTVRAGEMPSMVIEQTIPLTPNSCLRRIWVKSYSDTSTEALIAMESITVKVWIEDEELMPLLQNGKINARAPQLLGLYEERIGFFHDYLKSRYKI